MLRLQALLLTILLAVASASAQEEVFSPTPAQIDSVCDLPTDDMRTEPMLKAAMLEKYYDAAERQGNKKAMARLLSMLSMAYYNIDNVKSTEASLQAIKLYEELKDSLSLGIEYSDQGYRIKRRDLNKAFEYMRTGLAILEKINARQEYGKKINNLGVLHDISHNPDSAIHYYRLSASIKKEFNDSIGISYSYNNIFLVMLAERRMDSAFYYLELSSAHRENQKDGIVAIENDLMYGDYYRETKQYEKAIEYYDKAYRQAKSYGNKFIAQYATQSISQCYELMGRADEALKYYKIYVKYNDSLVNEQSNKSVAELEVRFDTEKKEKEIAEQKAELAQTELKVKQRNYLLAGLALVLIFIVIISYYIYRQQKFRQERLQRENQLKDQIAQVKMANQLQAERLRISRDLHDNIGSQLTFIISSLDNLRVALKNADEKTTARLRKINEFTRDTIAQLRDTIWAMNKEQITSEDLRERLINYFAKAESSVGIDLKLDTDIPGDIHFSNLQAMNIFRVIQEATNNAVKHSKASKIDVSMHRVNGSLSIRICDNGAGFDMSSLSSGHGLMNMRKRIEEVGGQLSIQSTPGSGTMIKIEVPLKQNTA